MRVAETKPRPWGCSCIQESQPRLVETDPGPWHCPDVPRPKRDTEFAPYAPRGWAVENSLCHLSTFLRFYLSTFLCFLHEHSPPLLSFLIIYPPFPVPTGHAASVWCFCPLRSMWRWSLRWCLWSATFSKEGELCRRNVRDCNYCCTSVERPRALGMVPPPSLEAAAAWPHVHSQSQTFLLHIEITLGCSRHCLFLCPACDKQGCRWGPVPTPWSYQSMFIHSTNIY